ncbi:MAG: hypothetical protein WDM86_09185 [Rhizomicrobium sp.]
MMSRIRGRDTAPELQLRKLIHALGFRYRTHVGSLPGRPDLVFPKYRAAVFVHGCFWHRHEGVPICNDALVECRILAEQIHRNTCPGFPRQGAARS